jgi:hypothetical protein
VRERVTFGTEELGSRQTQEFQTGEPYVFRIIHINNTGAFIILLVILLLCIIIGLRIEGVLGGVVIGAAISQLGTIGGQWLTWMRERRFKVAEIQRQAIHELQDALSDVLGKLPDAIKAKAEGRSATAESAIDMQKIVDNIDKSSSIIVDHKLKSLAGEFKQAALHAYNSGGSAPSGFIDAHRKLKEVNTRVRELMLSLFEG